MSAIVEQQKWAVRLRMRELPPGELCVTEADQGRWNELDIDAVLRGFSRDITSGSQADRVVAADAFGWLQLPAGVSPLLRALGDPDSEVRCAATSALARFSRLPAWAVDPLERALQDERSGCRASAVTALGATRDPGVLPAIASVLEDRLFGVQLAASDALHHLGRRGVRSSVVSALLVRLLDEPSPPHVAYAAYWALATQGAEYQAVRAAWRWSDHGQRVWTAVVGGRTRRAQAS